MIEIDRVGQLFDGGNILFLVTGPAFRADPLGRWRQPGIFLWPDGRHEVGTLSESSLAEDELAHRRIF